LRSSDEAALSRPRHRGSRSDTLALRKRRSEDARTGHAFCDRHHRTDFFASRGEVRWGREGGSSKLL
jgi:hypothetical protein